MDIDIYPLNIYKFYIKVIIKPKSTDDDLIFFVANMHPAEKSRM